MAPAFNADEIYEMGEQVERNGARFYRTALKRFHDPAVVELLQYLADQEGEHLKTFRRLRKELAARAEMPEVYDPQGEAQAYLMAAADNHVFRVNERVDAVLKDVGDVRSALEMALRFEKDTVAFFSAMENVVPAELGKADVGRLLAEEHEHIRMLNERMKKLGAA